MPKSISPAAAPQTEPSAPSPSEAPVHRTKKRRTLLSKILIWMFGPLFLLWSVGIVITYFIAQNIANAPYDRTLTDHLRLLKHEVEQQKISDGIHLSTSAISILQGDNEQLTQWEVRDENGLSIAGNAHIPLPDNWAYDKDKVRLRNDTINNQSVRIAYVWGGEDLNALPFLIIVAETNERRATLQQEILTGMLTPQLIVLPLAALLAGLGLTQGLEPLHILQERIRARRPNDLSPINQDLAPAEITPLLDAMNGLLIQLATTTETQRRFVSNAAHQLKTPLAGMRTQAELALREHSPEKMNVSLQQLVKGSERATRLVNQLLALTRAESPAQLTSEITDLNPIAEQQTLEWVGKALKKHIDLGFEPYEEATSVHGHSLMLAEMLNNLIENALLYTPEHGWVTVRVGRETGIAYLEVEDSGPGISADFQERIFDRFYRILGSSVDGSGLGLSIVKEIVDQHDATISFMPPTSRKGKPGGTCLRIRFARINNPTA